MAVFMDQSSDQSADRSMEQDDGRWLTYPELAAVRDIDKPSAIRLASRQKWRRQRDNRRVVRVLVPSDWLSPRYQSTDQPMERPDRDMDQSSDRQTDFAAALAAVQAAHAGEVAALHGQVAGLKALADRSMEQLAEATTRAESAETARKQADQALAEERKRADQLELAQDKLESERDAAEERARNAEHDKASATLVAEEAMRLAAERKARGRWARLRAAWRGE
jgi:hypothetical protein